MVGISDRIIHSVYMGKEVVHASLAFTWAIDGFGVMRNFSLNAILHIITACWKVSRFLLKSGVYDILALFSTTP